MRKILTICITLLLFSSCRDCIMNTEEKVVIIKMETKNNILCEFSTNRYINVFSKYNMSFVDSCGKFKLGDTIKFTKL